MEFGQDLSFGSLGIMYISKFQTKINCSDFMEKNNDALNCIMIIVRKEIFAAKCKHCLPVFDHIMSEIKSYYDINVYLYKKSKRK